MLQRKQSLFLIAAMFLIVSNLLVPFVATENLMFNAFKLESINPDNNIAISTFPIGIYLIILSVLNLITIFLFKNRPLQMRLTMLALFLSVGFYGVFLFYHFMSKDQIVIEFSSYSFGLIAPILAAVFDFMAYKGISNDEKIVRDSDRLR